jgi:hypothetical protein
LINLRQVGFFILLNHINAYWRFPVGFSFSQPSSLIQAVIALAAQPKRVNSPLLCYYEDTAQGAKKLNNSGLYRK